MKSLAQLVLESFPKVLTLSFFQMLMIFNVCDKYWWKSKWEESAESIGNRFNEMNLYKDLSNSDLSKLNQLHGDAYTDYFRKIEGGTFKLKNLSDKEVKDLNEMIENFANNENNKRRYGEGAITCLREIEGNNFHLLNR